MLCHYSPEPFVLDPHRSYQQEPERFAMKPVGLWLSVETTDENSYGWRDWCEGETFHLEALTYRTELMLQPDANVLQIDNPAALLAFADRFAANDARHGLLGSMFGINWSAVAAAYAGLIIAPYQWRLRLDHRVTWYYGWDCASGCIWDCRTLTVAGQTVTVSPQIGL